MTNDTADTKAVATEPGEETKHVDISGTTEASEIEAEWEANTPTLSALKTERKRQIKREARRALEETDWYIVRNQEQSMRRQTQQGLPQTVIDHRDNVKDLEGNAMDEINNADTKDAVRAVVVDWPDPPEPPL